MEPPPRPTTKLPVPAESRLHKTAFGRTKTLLLKEDERYSEIKCASAITQIGTKGKVFSSHSLNTRDWKTLQGTDVACFHCCHTFEGAPFAVPVSFDAYNKCYNVHGNFCSLSCAKTFVVEDEFSGPRALSLFNKMSVEVYNKTSVVAAPPRICLRFFGGHLSIDAFRKFGKTEGGGTISVLSPPFLNSYSLIEEQEAHSQTGSQLPTGTVRGLKRPAKGTVKLVEGAAPPGKSRYELFLDALREARGARNVMETNDKQEGNKECDPMLVEI